MPRAPRDTLSTQQRASEFSCEHFPFIRTEYGDDRQLVGKMLSENICVHKSCFALRVSTICRREPFRDFVFASKLCAFVHSTVSAFRRNFHRCCAATATPMYRLVAIAAVSSFCVWHVTLAWQTKRTGQTSLLLISVRNGCRRVALLSTTLNFRPYRTNERRPENHGNCVRLSRIWSARDYESSVVSSVRVDFFCGVSFLWVCACACVYGVRLYTLRLYAKTHKLHNTRKEYKPASESIVSFPITWLPRAAATTAPSLPSSESENVKATFRVFACVCVLLV